jgi:molybdate transport system regulatory protein
MDETKIPGGAYSDRIRARFWIDIHQKGYLGIGRIQLLEHIERHGSINKAAKEMGMSYKKAWKLIDELNAMFEEPLVIKVQGGKSGGGSQVSAKGQKVIQAFRAFEQRFAEFLQLESQRLDV